MYISNISQKHVGCHCECVQLSPTRTELSILEKIEYIESTHSINLCVGRIIECSDLSRLRVASLSANNILMAKQVD